ncbi:hypothetical protein TYRP_006358 [Tyrophagus putrescentiae]|nr:hypothetical protein TYRP_006358 [Tyrophagus putrescentiae]
MVNADICPKRRRKRFGCTGAGRTGRAAASPVPAGVFSAEKRGLNSAHRGTSWSGAGGGGGGGTGCGARAGRSTSSGWPRKEQQVVVDAHSGLVGVEAKGGLEAVGKAAEDEGQVGDLLHVVRLLLSQGQAVVAIVEASGERRLLCFVHVDVIEVDGVLVEIQVKEWFPCLATASSSSSSASTSASAYSSSFRGLLQIGHFISRVLESLKVLAD